MFGGVWSSKGVYLQGKHTKIRVFNKSCFPGPIVWIQGKSPLCSEISRSQELHPKPHLWVLAFLQDYTCRGLLTDSASDGASLEKYLTLSHTSSSSLNW